MTAADVPPMPASAMEEPRSEPDLDRRRWTRRTRLVLLVVWGLCFGLAGFVILKGGTFYVAERALPPGYWLVIMTVVINWATTYDERRGQPRWGLAALIGTLVAMFLGGILMTQMRPSPEASSSRSPDGRFTVVLTDADPVDSPAWELHVRQNGGLLSRQWYAGCIHDFSNTTSRFSGVTWINDTTFEVRTQTGVPTRFNVDQAGRPINPVAPDDDAICR